jgi:hypothetical protein
MDPADPGQQRVGRLHGQDVAVDVVEDLLAAEHREEERHGLVVAHAPDPVEDHLHVVGRGRDVEARPVDELLEHQRVLRFLGELVVHVAEGRVAVGEAGGEAEQARAQHALELDAHLDGGELAAQGDRRPPLRGLVAVPVRLGERFPRGRGLPAGVLGLDAMLRSVPVDVAVGLPVALDRRFRQALGQAQVGRGRHRRASRGSGIGLTLLGSSPISPALRQGE